MQPNVGVVSCLYSGVGPQNLWSKLQAMGINYHFLPNAGFGIAAGLVHPCFGCTIAIRRTMLEQIGGFGAFADCLAEDYEIGRAVRETGYEIGYAPVLVTHDSSEESFGTLVRHELRWARTTRTVALAGYLGSIVTYPLPLGLIGAFLLDFSLPACICFAALLASRLFLKSRMDRLTGSVCGPSVLLPIRDALSFGIFVGSLFGRVVEWQGTRFRIGARGAVSQF
jgi:ceramide glucosyltransferase